MKYSEKIDRFLPGFVAGLVMPFIVGIIIFLFSSGGNDLHMYLRKIAESDIITHSITLCVFPNVFIFILFNHFDMLRASRGILAVTIVWALIVFAVKFLT
jgi:hypothetical protein